MTIDEAIKCTEKLAKEFKLDAKISITIYAKENLNRLADEYEQLAEWLTELKGLREENKVLTSECDRLIKEKGELLSKVSSGDRRNQC